LTELALPRQVIPVDSIPAWPPAKLITCQCRSWRKSRQTVLS